MKERSYVDDGAGWRLALSRTRPTKQRGARPVLIVPGYGMNSFIFGFHPEGPSLIDVLAAEGLETWTVDLRGQGRSIRGRGNNKYGLADLAIEDLGAAIAHVLANTETGATELDVIGCSLGASLAFAHVACVPNAPVHSLVSMAGLVTWKTIHPALRVAFSSPRLVGMMRLKNTRRLARLALPAVATVAPSLLSIYINHRSTDLSQAAKMVQTVEDPHPIINREIAEWIKRKDLVVRGVNVSAALPSMTYPYLCVVANNDGIVQPETARATYDAIGSPHKALICVGDAKEPIAHADLFLAHHAQARVFEPVARFLREAP